MNAWLSYALLIGTCLLCLTAAFAVAYLLRVFRFSVPAKRLAVLELSQEDLKSQVEAINASHRRLISRVAMREAREAKADQPPKPKMQADSGDRKAELRRSLGLYGANAARVAQSIHVKPEITDGDHST